MALAYYNENDPEKVVALKALMAEGWIAPGEIDSKDIRDVNPAKLSRFTQCHFFAGIGIWSVAARAAGIPDDLPFWSGSCPCQPFSTAGAGEGIDDDRHLWPHWFWLIHQQRPAAVVGEQVSTKDGLAWLDLVCADMEGSSYAGGSIDLCSAGFGSPNIRQRQYMCWLDNRLGDRWGPGGHRDHRGDERIVAAADGDHGRMGNAAGAGSQGNAQRGTDRPDESRGARHAGFAGSGRPRGMGDSERSGLERQRGDGDREAGWQPGSARPIAEAGDAHGLASADERRSQPGRLSEGQGRSDQGTPLEYGRSESDSDRGRAGPEFRDQMQGPTNGFWADADWLLCRDIDGPKLRPVRAGSFCLAPRNPGRAAELRAYGDAINLQVATEFLKAIKPELMRIMP